jgi:hypothetical protein
VHAALLALLLVCGAYDIWRYHHDWPKHGAHIGNQTFNRRLADVSAFLNSLPASTPRIVVHEDDPSTITRQDLMHPPGRVDFTLPLPAQSIVFATMNNVEPRFVYFPDALRAADEQRIFAPGSIIAPMENRVHTLQSTVSNFRSNMPRPSSMASCSKRVNCIHHCPLHAAITR